MSEQFHALTPSTLKETDNLRKRKCRAVIPKEKKKKKSSSPARKRNFVRSVRLRDVVSFIWRQGRLKTMVAPDRNYELETTIA
jgi:hypothetical protein